MSKPQQIPQQINENNVIVLSDVSDELVVLPTVSVRSKDTVNVDDFLEIHNKKKQRDAASKKREIPIVKLLKPAYESVSETDKVTFLNDLSVLFKEKSQAKKETFDKKFDEDTTGVINDYNTLSLQLQASIPLLRHGTMLRSSITYHPKLFVFFTSTNTIKKQFDEINTKVKKKSPNEIRLQADLKNKLETSNNRLANFSAMITEIKKHIQLKSFTDFLKKKTSSTAKVQYERLLFLIIMQGYDKNPPDSTIIEPLTMALKGTYKHVTTAGGKRKTKKNKINKLIPRKTRSIKQSKKNKTRRK